MYDRLSFQQLVSFLFVLSITSIFFCSTACAWDDIMNDIDDVPSSPKKTAAPQEPRSRHISGSLLDRFQSKMPTKVDTPDPPDSKTKNTSKTAENGKVASHAKALPAGTLFNGSMGNQWLELSNNGGDFKKFARFEDHILIVDVPRGNKSGQTGIRSAAPLVKIPENGTGLATKVTFIVDAKRSSDYVFSFIPPNWDGNQEWRSHQIRVGVSSSESGKSSTLALWIRKSKVMVIKLVPHSLEQFNIILRSDRLVLITDKDQKILLQTALPDNISVPAGGYRISALTDAPESGMPAKMALRNILLAENQPFDKIPAPSILLDKPNQVVIFDGKLMGHLWEPFVDGKVTFDEAASLQNGSLVVDVPANAERAMVGLKSRQPVFWLDQFGRGAERSIAFKLQREQTTGFVFALSNGSLHYFVKWSKNPETGRGSLQIYLDTSLTLQSNWNHKVVPVWEQEITTVPEEIILTLKPGEITMSGKGLPEYTHSWSLISPNSSFDIYVYSFPFAVNQPVKMALREIIINNSILVPVTSRQAEGVAALPVKTFFSNERHNGWEMTPWATLDNKPIDVCFLNKSGFGVLPFQGDLPSLNGCNLHTDKEVIQFDKRLTSTEYKVSAYFDPKKTSNFHIAWAKVLKRHNWDYRQVSLLQSKNGENVFSFSRSSSQRVVSSDWLQSEWNGKVNLIFGEGWIQAELDGGPSMRVNVAPVSKLYVYVLAPDYRARTTIARLLLKKLTGEWIPPDGMSKLDRWHYLNDEDFDPNAFLADLAATTLAESEDEELDELLGMTIETQEDVDSAKEDMPMAIKSGQVIQYEANSSKLLMTTKFLDKKVEVFCSLKDGRAKRSFSGGLSPDPKNNNQLIGHAQFAPLPGGEVSYSFGIDGKSVMTLWKVEGKKTMLIRWIPVLNSEEVK